MVYVIIITLKNEWNTFDACVQLLLTTSSVVRKSCSEYVLLGVSNLSINASQKRLANNYI